MKVEQLKEKARGHELREEWQKAFDLYRSALRGLDEDEPPDITLFNRLGDIQTRLGQISGAVEQYEKAIELYLEAELPNNAIAICKKVLRNLPERNIFYLRMGQIRAGQGFLTDARQNFLTYAERQTARGDHESALNALVEFVELSPEDVEIRQGLASQLESHERTGEAVEQYREIYRLSVLASDDDEANRVEEKLGELAPDMVLPDSESIRAEAASSDMGVMVLESTSLGGLELDGVGGGEGFGFDSVEVDLGGDTAQDEEEDEAEAEPGSGVVIPDLEFDEMEMDDAASLLEGSEGDEAETLPSFEFDSEAEAAEAVPSFGLGEADLGEVSADEDSLPLIGFDEGEEGEAAEDEVEDDSLPLLGFQDLDDVESEDEDPLPLLEIEEEGEEATESVDEIPPLEAAFEDAAFEAGQVQTEEPEEAQIEEAEPVFQDTPVDGSAELDDHKVAADRGELGLAIEGVKALIEGAPDDVELHQRLVEYAFRKNDQAILISAYMDLAGCLARTGAPMKADAVYQQVLSLSPGHEGATAALQVLGGSSGAKPPAQVASSEEYVDLGSMILGDDAEATTRWQVAAEAPSGDDEADFAKMLGQFKEKVSEHVAVDDVSAHHDLGTAYMEMGLFEEAVGEFQMALRASPGHLPTHEVMGRCWMEMGKPDMAIRALDRALNVPFEVEDELIGIYYLMGRAQEDQGNNDEALEFYEKVFSLDINFEDVTERLRALR